MSPRVLYLHGLREGSGSKFATQLERLIPAGDLSCPDLRTTKAALISLLILLIGVAGNIAGIVLGFVRLPLWGGFTLGGILILSGGVGGWLTMRGMSSLIVNRGVRSATNAYDRRLPNLIIASGFGAVIARRIARPKPPIMLLAPALEKYAKWCGDKSHRRLDGYPYVLIVHDSRNRSVRVNDSFRTIERADPGRSRLEVLELTAAHPEISDIELKSFIDETYESGKAAVIRLREAGHPIDQIISPIDFGSNENP